jgi:basic membrane protein A
MKKLLALALALVMLVCVASCGASNNTVEDDEFKVGVILLGDETEGYTLAHINGINGAVKTLGISDSQVSWKKNVHENEDCFAAAEQLVADGCDIIISNSYGHQDFMAQAAEKYPDVAFVSATGDYAAISGLDNFYNVFTCVYQSRYVAGVVAGLKLKELIETNALSAENFDADGNVKIGYVGAFPFAEVVSGYTSYYLGVKSVVENVVMEVVYTESWFDIEGEAAGAETLMANGCVIISQHADSTGAPTAVQKAKDNGKTVFSVGYNISMLDVAPTAALTSATTCWDVAYAKILKAAMNGDEIPQDVALGYKDNGVTITELGTSVAAGTAEAVEQTIASLKDGSIRVFDTSKFTVGGETLTECMVDLSYIDFATMTVIYEGETVNAIVTENGVSYFNESAYRSAPYFSVRIDGIIEK